MRSHLQGGFPYGGRQKVEHDHILKPKSNSPILTQINEAPHAPSRLNPAAQKEGNAAGYRSDREGGTMANLVFFIADDGSNDPELWVTDGTTGGTRPVRTNNSTNDPAVPPKAIFPLSIADLGDGRVVFSAREPGFGNPTELWITDGTHEGTQLLADIGGTFSSSPTDLTLVRPGLMVFSANDGIHGEELWATDGTANGTRLLADAHTGSAGSFPSDFFSLGTGRVFFTADDGVHGREIWVSDGTASGTQLLRDFLPGNEAGASYTTFYAVADNKAVFAADDGVHGEELWLLSGSGEVTLLRDFTPGPNGGITELGSLPGDRFEFKPSASDTWSVTSMITDGTAAGTVTPHESTQTASPLPEVADEFVEPLGWSADVGEYGLTNVGQNRAQLPDGRMVFGGNIQWSQEGQSPNSMASNVLWVVESSDAEPQPLWNPITSDGETGPVDTLGFKILPDGRLAFNAETDATEGTKLFVTDGTAQGTELFGGDLNGISSGLLHFPNGTALFVGSGHTEEITDGTFASRQGLWTTNGSSGGTTEIVPDIHAFDLIRADLGNDYWLISTHRTVIEYDGILDDTGNDAESRTVYDLWSTNGSELGTNLLLSDYQPDNLSAGVVISPGKTIATYYEDGGSTGEEPWVVDAVSGSMTLLADIYPGATSSFASLFTEVTSLGGNVDAPVSTLFPIRLSLEEQPNAFDLDDYFTDPGGDTLEYQVTGLPGDIALNSTTNELSTSAITQSGTHTIEVTAINDEGTAVTSSFNWSIVDTGKLKISTTGDWVSNVETKQISSTAGSVITVGHKDGVHGLLRIEGEAGQAGAVMIDKGNLIVKGKVFSDQVSTTKPIMEGEFTINMATLAVSKFKDEKKNDDHRLVDGLIDLQFADLSIYRDKVSFQTDLLFDGTTGGSAPAYAALSTKGAPLAATFGANGLDLGMSVGTQRWAPEPLSLNLGAASSLTLGFSNLGADYDAASDSLYISGKASVEWGGELENGFDFIDNDSAQSLTIDLAGNIKPGNYFQRGDKYLKLSPDASGGWDWAVVGEIKYEDKNKGPLGTQELGVKELKVTFDTVKDQYVGSFKAGIPALFPSPFSTSNDILASLGFLTNPSVRLDSFSLGLDGLNLPVGATGVFLQGGSVGMQGLGTLDPNAPYTYQADVTGSWGPSTDALPSPIRGKITGQVKLPEIEASVQLDSKVGYFVPNYVNAFAAPLVDYFGVTPSDVANFVLFDLRAQTKIDVVKGDFSIGGTVQLIGGAVTGQGLVRNFTDATTATQKNLVASLSGTFKMPDAFPVIGGLQRSGNALLTYSADGNASNDFVAAWTKVTIPLLFTTKVYSFGAQYNFDGTYKVLGNNTIPKTSSWTFEPNVELVVLSAEWDTASTTTRLEVIAPDGSVLTETDIALRDDMAIVTDLDSPTSRHVALYQPDAGIWDLRVADAMGLGNVTYVANEMLAGAAAEFVSVTPTPADHSASVQIATTLGDATTAQVTLFASEETDQLGGIELGHYTVTAGDSGFTHDLDYGRLGPGTWYVYARTEADGIAPDVQMYATPLTVAGAADLNMGMTQNIDPTTDAPVITIDISNTGDRPSNAGVLVVTAPDTMTGAAPVSAFDATPLATPQSKVPLPVLAPGESVTLSFALPVGADISEATIGADIFTTGADADMSDNKVAFILEDTTNQTILGTEFADALFGGTGDDSIDGLAGVDTARYSGPQISYTLSLSASGEITLTDRRANGDGTDLLENVERLDFEREIALLNGQPLDLAVFGGPTRLFPDDFESFIELYIAYFNRAPDAVGLNFWGTAFSNGTTLSEMATLFIDQPETRATYPSGLSNTDFATAVYDNVLGRIPDQAGFDFWVGALDSQAVGRDQFILAVLDGAKASPFIGASQDFIDQQLADRAYLATKTDIGAYFAVLKGMSNVDNASAAMALYDGTNSGLTSAVAAIDAFHQSALDPVSGEFLMPLVGVLDDPFANL